MSGNVKHISNKSEVEERFAALLTNAAAIQSVASAVEGTLGPKGLNCMLVDSMGDITVTNDGSAILDQIETNHPAARMLIKAAKAQDQEVGDGTTTTTVLASALVTEGVKQIMRGVPVTKVLEGLRVGLRTVQDQLQAVSQPVESLEAPCLFSVAKVAARSREDLAELVLKAAQVVGSEQLRDKAFKLSEQVLAQAGAGNEVVQGLIIDKERMNRQMPTRVQPARILVIDDALEPEEIEDDALGTESGFAKYLQLREDLQNGLQKIVELGVNVVVVERGVCDAAEEIFTDHQVMVLRRISPKEIARIVEHTGAHTLKRSSLKKSPEELKPCLGEADLVYQDQQLKHVRILGGKGKPAATILVGAATEEVKDEQERIAKDAASALQAALLGGVLAGGGASEIAVLPALEEKRNSIEGMAAYGIDCVIEAMKKPLAQIVHNAGFNPLDRVEKVISCQHQQANVRLGIDCDSGEVADMVQLDVLDPTLVRTHAIRTAGEIAESVLRINTIIKRRNKENEQ